MAIAVLFGILFLLCVYVGWLVRGGLLRTVEVVMPVMDQLVNHTVGLLANADAASAHVRTAAHSGEVISATALPQVMGALNATQQIVARLEALARHPVVQLSLGGQGDRT